MKTRTRSDNMAASCRRLWRSRVAFFIVMQRYSPLYRTVKSKTAFFFGSSLTAYAISGVTLKHKEEKLRFPDPSSLTHTALIRNACGLSVDATTALLSQTTAAILQVQKEYTDAVKHLIRLLEDTALIKGDRMQEDKLWEQIIVTRAEIFQHKKDKEQLELILNSAEKAITGIAEAAFLAGAESYSFMASERLNSAHQHIRSGNHELEDVLVQLAKMEVDYIAKMAPKDTKAETKEKDGIDFEKALKDEFKKEKLLDENS